MLQYGAYGDCLHDDTLAINAAIADGERCGSGCESSSLKGAIVNFPTGMKPLIPIVNLLTWDRYLPCEYADYLTLQHPVGRKCKYRFPTQYHGLTSTSH